MVKFLVAVDGSPAANAAAYKAAALAKPGDEILAQPLAIESEVGFGDLKQRMITQGEEVIKKYKALVPESHLSDVNYKFELLQGNPREVLLQYTSANSIDTLVIGQVGLTSAKRTAVGSTSDYCLRNCSCDVLICKYNEKLNLDL